MLNTMYQSAIGRGRVRWGDKFVEPQTTAEQRRFFQNCRVEVTTTYPSGEKFTRRGRISITTGWEPVLLLVHRRNAYGSWDTLKSSDQITAWIDSRGKRHPI